MSIYIFLLIQLYIICLSLYIYIFISLLSLPICILSVWNRLFYIFYITYIMITCFLLAVSKNWDNEETWQHPTMVFGRTPVLTLKDLDVYLLFSLQRFGNLLC